MSKKSIKPASFVVNEMSDVEMQHSVSLISVGDLAAKKKKCKKQEIVIQCTPQLVSCEPVVVVPDCDPVVIIIKN